MSVFAHPGRVLRRIARIIELGIQVELRLPGLQAYALDLFNPQRDRLPWHAHDGFIEPIVRLYLALYWALFKPPGAISRPAWAVLGPCRAAHLKEKSLRTNIH